MKNRKLSALFATPLRLMVSLGLIIMLSETLIMTVIHDAIGQIDFLIAYWDFADSILLTLMISPVLYSLVYQRLQSEELLQQINGAAQDAIVVVNENGRIIDWNPAAQRMFHYSREEALGQQMHQMLAPSRYLAEAERGFAHFQQTGEGPMVGKIREIVAVRKDGSEFPVEIYISALQTKGRWHTVGVMRDITERKRGEEEVRKLNEELEEKVKQRTADLEHAMIEAEKANRAKSDFLASMSHEIRTPMNGVIGMIDVLHQSSLHGYQVEMVKLIRESAYSLLGIINDILDFSRIEANKLEIEHAPIAVDEVVESVCHMLDDMAVKKGVELTLFVDPAIPAEVMGDMLRLRQVLINLANNAIKFSSKQQAGRVSVRALLLASMPQQVTLGFRVADNGIGMDERALSGLFTPFTQADISTTRRFGGSGLGLSIVHHLVELMGGEIMVQSEPGKGSIFNVRISFELAPKNSATSVTPSPVEGLSCVVVGASGSLSDDFATYLAHAGARVERAADFAAAQTPIAGFPPGLYIVIIDTAGGEVSPDELRAARANTEARFVLIGRGLRREPRLEEAGLVLVDGNGLARKTLLKAVSIAAGRIQEEREAPPSIKDKMEFIPPPRDVALRQGRLILVAEDNETNQKVILRQLALLRFAADIADNGRAALEYWQSGNYALLLSDLHMPEMDGYELAAAIRTTEDGKTRKPIIAITANALKGEAEHCREVGMDDYLSKPVQLANLKAMLDKWLPEVMSGSPDEATRNPGSATQNIPDSVALHPGYAAPASAPVNVNVLKALVGDDAAIITEFLHDFRLSANKIAVELRTAHAQSDTAAVGALAHKLKSSARSVGALALGELCARMEKAGKANDFGALTTLLPGFDAECAAVDNYLDSI